MGEVDRITYERLSYFIARKEMFVCMGWVCGKDVEGLEKGERTKEKQEMSWE